MKNTFTNSMRLFAYIAWLQALVAMLVSLYFSEIAGFPPCILCWYQRISLYPLVVIVLVGILTQDRKLPYYVLPLALVGWGISIYHNLLYWKLLPEASTTCRQGISCTSQFIEYFGFITIPFLSLVAFSIITFSMIAFLWLSKSKKARSSRPS